MKAAIVGCGAIAGRWIRSLAVDGRLTVGVLVDSDLAAAERLAERYGLSTAYAATVDEALAEHRPEVVINLTPPRLHHWVSRSALEAGAHVLTEKPLALRLADASALVELAQQRGLVLAVMQNRGRDRQFIAFRDQVRQLGDGPYLVTAETLVPLRTPGFRREQPLPATSDLAVHAFDQVRALIAAQPVEVTCTETPVSFLDAHCAATTITVRFSDASLFSYRGAFTAQADLRTDAGGSWRVEGRGFAASWTAGIAVGVADSAGSRSVTLPAHVDVPGYQLCVSEMVDAIHHPGKAPCPAAENLGSIALLEAAITSGTARRPAMVHRVPRRWP
ncbi:Gfo/Idh/MocA family protein [Kitasatospora azatica]|uniref:Gfo/Idh/MocA family protein n=1 Tax=Kitasatospora azatica TaxID=58347 RepID=UPI000A04238F|nr:Gfo/Idh/MocA family oxidoreductase [Kitasatospora azatica]